MFIASAPDHDIFSFFSFKFLRLCTICGQFWFASFLRLLSLITVCLNSTNHKWLLNLQIEGPYTLKYFLSMAGPDVISVGSCGEAQRVLKRVEREASHRYQVSISSMFYIQLLRLQSPKAPNDSADMTVFFCAFRIYVRKSCRYVMKLTTSVNFINVLLTAFMLADPKSVKRYWQLDLIIMLLGAN